MLCQDTVGNNYPSRRRLYLLSSIASSSAINLHDSSRPAPPVAIASRHEGEAERSAPPRPK